MQNQNDIAHGLTGKKACIFLRFESLLNKTQHLLNKDLKYICNNNASIYQRQTRDELFQRVHQWEKSFFTYFTCRSLSSHLSADLQLIPLPPCSMQHAILYRFFKIWFSNINSFGYLGILCCLEFKCTCTPSANIYSTNERSQQ